MWNVVLYQPEIPPNTGNVIRLCANTGASLHLVGPLGFSLDEPRLRRAGLDYHALAGVQTYDAFDEFLRRVQPSRVFACSTRGHVVYDRPRFVPGDAFLFGPETRGLTDEQLAAVGPEQRLRIPMVAGNRSLNLSNAVAVVVYEAWRQAGFAGAGG